MTQINKCMGNTGNVYRNIRNVFKNHITVIEKNDITIHIDIELLSSPTFLTENTDNKQAKANVKGKSLLVHMSDNHAV